MRRREFITLLGGAAAAWPVIARAQQPAMPVVGLLSALARDDSKPTLTEAFREVWPKLVTSKGATSRSNTGGPMTVRSAANVGRRFAAAPAKWQSFNAAGGGGAVLAAKAATTTVPIVFLNGGDPIQEGFVGSLNRPGGNLTGISWFGTLLAAKALELFKELVPGAALVGLMVDPNLPEAARTQNDARKAARTLGWNCSLQRAPTWPTFTRFAAAQRRGRRIARGGDPFFTARRQQIVALAIRGTIPAMYPNREFAEEGGLMSYGNDVADGYRRAALHVAGFSRVRNHRRSAGRSGSEVRVRNQPHRRQGTPPRHPATLLSRADEVIE